MARIHVETDARTGEVTSRAYTLEEEAAADAIVAATTVERARIASYSSDATRVDILNRLKTATASQIRTYVTADVTDLASARTMLANILILIALDSR